MCVRVWKTIFHIFNYVYIFGDDVILPTFQTAATCPPTRFSNVDSPWGDILIRFKGVIRHQYSWNTILNSATICLTFAIPNLISKIDINSNNSNIIAVVLVVVAAWRDPSTEIGFLQLYIYTRYYNHDNKAALSLYLPIVCQCQLQ